MVRLGFIVVLVALIGLLVSGLVALRVYEQEIVIEEAALSRAIENHGRRVQERLSERELLKNAITSPFTGPVAARIQMVLPGGSISVTVTGNFPAGTTFLSERDGVTISGAAQTTTTYSARLTIPPDEGPGYVRLFAITPVGIEGFVAVAVVDTLYRFALKSPDGYTVKIVPLEKTFTVDNVQARVKYQAEFYKPGESKPFEVSTGYQTFYVGNDPLESRTPYAGLDISVDQSTS